LIYSAGAFPLTPQKLEGAVEQLANILIVDDTPANLQVLAGMLKDRGYKVRPVPSGKLALLAAKREPPDLILLDINMPEINGYEVSEHLKADELLAGIPVIFISALTDPLDKVKAFSIGGLDYITKPFRMEELHARVATHLKLHSLQVKLLDANKRLADVNNRMSRDLMAAAKIQESFLPRNLPRVPGTDFAWIYRPCDELVGDGLNIIPLGDDKVALYILDVSGHGVASALLSVTLSRLLSLPSDPSSILIRDADLPDGIEISPPAEVAAHLNRLFPFDSAITQFATLLYGVLNTATGEFRYVSAGHPGPVHLPRNAEPVILESTGSPIGLADDGLYNMVPQEALQELLGSNASAESACRKLVDLANENGGKDNITVIVSHFLAPQAEDSRAFVEAEVPLSELTSGTSETSQTAVFTNTTTTAKSATR
jgi:phosphoserine phosphatase RsbU/P